MSVLIKGMRMPENCEKCQFHIEEDIDFDICRSCGAGKNGYIHEADIDGFPADCPMVGLGKHGDLIDRDALKEDLRMGKECDKDCPTDWKACHYDRVYAKQDFCSWLDDADTVIEAEGGT